MALGSVLRNGVGFASLVGALALSWPGVQAVQADSPPPEAQNASVDASMQPAADASMSSQMSEGDPADFDGFVDYMRAQRRYAPVAEAAGPACGGGGVVTTPEFQQRQAMALVRARMKAAMQAQMAAGDGSEVVVLNNHGYNYRVEPHSGAVQPAQPGGGPADR